MGGKLQLFSHNHNIPLPIDIPVPFQPGFAPAPEFINWVEYLCLIQAKTGTFLQLQDDVILEQDRQILIELVTIIEYGKLRN